MEKYNGWKNRQTWNVAWWINNDEPLYRVAVEYVKEKKGNKALYLGFIKNECLTNCRTPNNISYSGTRLNYKELNEMMADLID